MKSEGTQKHYYSVGIRKEYFPERLHPPVKEMSAYFEVVRILASSRLDAAVAAWRQHGTFWMRLMNPDTTINGNRIISLEVNDPVRKINGGRIGAIKVYEGIGR